MYNPVDDKDDRKNENPKKKPTPCFVCKVLTNTYLTGNEL